MKIIVSKIPKEGIEIHSSVDAAGLNIDSSDFILNDNVHIDALINKDGDIFFVDGSIKTVIQVTCSRCAMDFPYPVYTVFHCHEEPVSSANKDMDMALKRGDMDVDHYAGDEVEINNLFREQLILAVPMYPLCRPDCPGLCPICGHNLNNGNCGCKKEDADNPFAVIKKLFE